MVHINDAIKRFVRTESLNNGKSPGKPPFSKEVVGLKGTKRGQPTNILQYLHI